MALSIVKPASEYFEIRISSVVPRMPLQYDLFLVINRRPTLFRKMGDALSKQRIQMLYKHGGEKFLVREDQRELYLRSLKTSIQDPSTSSEDKAIFIKESAFLHINDLFTKGEVAPVVKESQLLVGEMVNFVTSDITAVSTLMRLSRHDYYTYNHCVDVAVYAIALAKKAHGDNKEMLMQAGLGGLLHDIGKRDVRHELINKSSPLTPQEWLEIKEHPIHGKKCLEHVECVPEASRRVVFEHHENFDGTGYPSKLRGDEISDLARIVTIADVFDALTTDRSYHKAVPPKEAMDIMYGMQPGKFDPNLFKSFNKNFKRKSPMKLPKDFDPCTPQSVAKILKKA